MEEEKRTDFGYIKIHRNAIASCAALAAEEIGGVKVVPRTVFYKVLNWITKGRWPSHKAGVRVEFGNRNEVGITISIFIEYGLNIPEIASSVQENVKKTVERTTGLYLSDVDVKVKGIIFNSRQG